MMFSWGQKFKFSFASFPPVLRTSAMGSTTHVRFRGFTANVVPTVRVDNNAMAWHATEHIRTRYLYYSRRKLEPTRWAPPWAAKELW
jgi:hypothetical protein